MTKYKGYLIGDKLSNSFSKEIYTSISKLIEYSNKKIKNEDDFANFILSKKYDFVNITSPYKMFVREFLDKESSLVKATGVCNLVINVDGILEGYNTDVCGFESLLGINDIKLEDKKVAILGNGATSRTVEYVCKKLKAQKIEIACRNKKNPGDIFFNDIDEEAEIIINTTSLGKNFNDKKLVDLSKFKKLETFIDVVYKPFRTPLMLDAINLGKGAINGFDMLFYQAKEAYELVTKNMIPFYEWLNLRKTMILGHINLVFVGLPTSGKTKTCNELKKLLNTEDGKSFLDTDEVVED